MDPTIGMLALLVEATGRGLVLAAGPPVVQLGELSNAWKASPRGDLVDWTRLRAFLDYLAAHPERIATAIDAAPRESGSALLDNLLAGIAETLADEQQIVRPAWTRQVPPLAAAWMTPGTPRTQENARLVTPPALLARGVTLSRSSLWR